MSVILTLPSTCRHLTLPAKDGGMQSSHWDVDVWNISRPNYTHSWSKSFQNFPMSSDIWGVADLFVKKNSWRNNKKRHCFHLSTKEEIESDFVQFNKPPKTIPQKDHRGLVVVVNKYDGSLLDIGVSEEIHSQLNGTLNVPFILSANEVGSHLQHFYCLNKNELDVLCITYKDGLPLNDARDFAGQIDNVIWQHSCTMFTLLSLDKVIPHEEMESAISLLPNLEAA
jgi:hypothetical protein